MKWSFQWSRSCAVSVCSVSAEMPGAGSALLPTPPEPCTNDLPLSYSWFVCPTVPSSCWQPGALPAQLPAPDPSCGAKDKPSSLLSCTSVFHHYECKLYKYIKTCSFNNCNTAFPISSMYRELNPSYKRGCHVFVVWVTPSSPRA